MKSTFRILFYLKKNEPKKDGTVTIMARITVDGETKQFSTKKTILPEDWDITSGRAVNKSGKSTSAKIGKSDLAALDRKIQLSLKPVKQNEDSNSKDESQTENKGHGITPSPGTPSASPTTSPASDGKPYVHQPPDFLSAPPEKKPPHLNQPPVSFSIKDAMNSLGSKLVIGGIPKPGNKDAPDTAHTNKPKGFKL